MNKEDCLNAFKAMSEGMIEKDPLKLKESMSKDSVLYHMTGRKESREGFIKDILNGILNYYDYRIDFFELNNDVANVKI